MNLNDQHIDDLFRKAADTSKSPAYNPSYWSEMEQLLNAERKRRKGLIAWSVFGMISLFGLLSTAVTIDREHPLTYAKIGLSVELNSDYLLEIKSDFEEFIASQKVISSEAPSTFLKDSVNAFTLSTPFANVRNAGLDLLSII